jgi:hypothetical protein
MAGRKIKNESDARACLGAATTSGLDRVAWSRAHGVDARSLNAWRVALERRASSAREPKLIELVPSTARRTVAKYILDLGVARLEFDDDWSMDTLQRVVQALRAC